MTTNPCGLLDVREFGALGDGQTDNTVALQSAINAAASRQATLHVPAGVYLTGGTSLLQGVAGLAEEVRGLPVHRPSTAPISGLTATFENPQYATPIGLIRYAQLLENERPRRSPFASLVGKVGTFFSGVKTF